MSEKTKYCEKAVSIHTLAYLARYEALRAQPKVNEGDIIFLKDKLDNIKCAHKVKLTFKVESIHESGLIIARKILPNGKLGPSEIVNDGPWIAEVDHTYIENIIMNNEDKYDPSVAVTELEKEKRRITKHNKSISIKTSNEAELEELIKSLKIGDIFWYNETLINLKQYRCEVIDKPCYETFTQYVYGSRPAKNVIFIKLPIKKYYMYHGVLSHYTTHLTVTCLKNHFFTKEEPMSLNE